MKSSELIEAIENDQSASYWLLEQVRQIDKRDILNLIRDVEILKKVLKLRWDEYADQLSDEMMAEYEARISS